MRVETFAFFCGIAYLAAGLLGLVPAALMPAPADAPPIHVTLFHGYLVGLFAVNVLHSAVHFAIGVWGIVAGRGMTSPKVYARKMHGTVQDIHGEQADQVAGEERDRKS